MSQPRRRLAVHAVLVWTVMTSAMLGWTCLLAPAIHDFPGPPRWWIPGDVWSMVPPARYVANGAFPSLYEAEPSFVYPPGTPLLLAPLVALGDRLQLTESSSVIVQRPTLWLLYAPLAAATTAGPILAGAQLLVAARRRPAPWIYAAAALACAPVLVAWGHFEELIVAGALLFAVGHLAARRWTWAGAALAVALLTKQTALLGVPLLLLRLPRGQRLRTTFISVMPVMVLGAICVLGAPSETSSALLSARSFPVTGHAALWAGAGEVIVATPIRVGGTLLSMALAWRWRSLDDVPSTVRALGVLMYLRLLFEPVLFAYYVGVPIVLLSLASAFDERLRNVAVPSVLLLALFIPRTAGPVWWIGFTSLSLALVVPAVRRLELAS